METAKSSSNMEVRCFNSEFVFVGRKSGKGFYLYGKKKGKREVREGFDFHFKVCFQA